MRLPILSCAVLALVSLDLHHAMSQAVPSPREAIASYEAKLAARCGEKHLNWISPGELRDVIDDFTKQLPAARQAIILQSQKQSCTGGEMGATCGNVGFLKVAIQVKDLDAFVAKVCSLKESCAEASNCSESK